MLEEAYTYGLTPKEATELTLAEMASFISANRRAELERSKLLARIGYSAGMLGSMSLAKKRPRFEEIFQFPHSQDNQNNATRLKAQMLVWAEQMNRLARKTAKK